jgi:hypothetical protein
METYIQMYSLVNKSSHRKQIYSLVNKSSHGKQMYSLVNKISHEKQIYSLVYKISHRKQIYSLQFPWHYNIRFLYIGWLFLVSITTKISVGLHIQYTQRVSTIILSGRTYSFQNVRQIWESTLLFTGKQK